MKKQNSSKFLKSKSFYVLLSVGALAVLVIAVVGIYQASNENNRKFAQLEEQTPEVIDEDVTNEKTKPDNNNEPPSSVANNNESNEKVEITKNETDDLREVNEPTTDDRLLEFDAYDDPRYAEELSNEEIEIQEVMSPTTLHFNHETDALLWPVSGNVIRKYSMDSLVHYATLAQWKVSPAMLISAEEGEEVTCAADGIVTSIEENEETGITVTSSIGDGYTLIYGQIEDLTIGEGDTIEKGQIIGKLSKPTRYNSIEGPSLYIQLLNGEETLDPMLCLE